MAVIAVTVEMVAAGIVVIDKVEISDEYCEILEGVI